MVFNNLVDWNSTRIFSGTTETTATTGKTSAKMTKPHSNMSQIRDFMAYLATVKGDLSNITAPPFVLAPKSVTEIPACWAERHELFLAPAREEDPERRALLILKNFLCSLKRQVYATPISPQEEGDNGVGAGGARKPLNAFLGELFLGHFADPWKAGSKTQLIAEQVSHHPPVTACQIYNKTHGISSSGYVAQETSFTPSGGGIRVRQVGHIIIEDQRHGESHLMTLPTMMIKGLLTGVPYPELEGTCYIASSSGFLAKAEFGGTSTLGLGGTKNHVKAQLLKANQEGGKPLFEIEGQWSGRMSIKDVAKKSEVEEFHVDKDVPLSEVQIAPVEKQSPWESRRAWSGVLEGIRRGDFGTVKSNKDDLEEAQRDIRAVEKYAGVDWHRVFFTRQESTREEDHPTFTTLAKMIPDAKERSLHADRTGGVWRFIGAGAADSVLAKGVYHSALEPRGQIQQQKN